MSCGASVTQSRGPDISLKCNVFLEVQMDSDWTALTIFEHV